VGVASGCSARACVFQAYHYYLSRWSLHRGGVWGCWCGRGYGARNPDELTEEEIDDLVDTWEPEPLIPPSKVRVPALTPPPSIP
jgi:hypothetical protein